MHALRPHNHLCLPSNPNPPLPLTQNSGTGTHDGCAIAFAVLDRLTSPGRAPRLLFATHYASLTTDPALAGRVVLGHMRSELVDADDIHGTGKGGDGGAPGEGGRGQQQPGAPRRRLALANTFELRPGAAPLGSCGVDVAAAAGLPAEVVARARQVAAAMEAATGGGGGGGAAARARARACGAAAALPAAAVGFDEDDEDDW